jgi:hypothetical protein
MRCACCLSTTPGQITAPSMPPPRCRRNSLRRGVVRVSLRCEIRSRIFAAQSGFGLSVLRAAHLSLAGFADLCDGRSAPRTLAIAGGKTPGLRENLDATRSRPGHGIPNAQIWRVPQSAVAVHATPCESWDLSPRAGHDAAAATGRSADTDRPHAFLSRTSHRWRGGIRRVPVPWKSFEPSPG